MFLLITTKGEVNKMNLIDWSCAPSDATHHCAAYNEFSEVWIKELEGDSYKFRVAGNVYAEYEWEFAEPIIRNELKNLTIRPKTKESNMIQFDLERALAGDKVVTVDGREVDQLHVFTAQQTKTLYGVMGGVVEQWNCLGQYHAGESVHITNLIMAPKKLSGFVNYYSAGCPTHHNTLDGATQTSDRLGQKNGNTIARIDLSQFEEGHGL